MCIKVAVKQEHLHFLSVRACVRACVCVCKHSCKLSCECERACAKTHLKNHKHGRIGLSIYVHAISTFIMTDTKAVS